MTPPEGNPLPSRRALREQQGWLTGAIDLPDVTEDARPAEPLTENSPPASAVPTAGSAPPFSPEPPAHTPPLTRRQRRERETALATGSIPLTPEPGPPEPAAPASTPPAPAAPAPAVPAPAVPEPTTVEAPFSTPPMRDYGVDNYPAVAPGSPPAGASSSTPPTTPPAPAMPPSGPARGAEPDSRTPPERLLTRRERREMELRGEPVPETGKIPVLPEPTSPTRAGDGSASFTTGPTPGVSLEASEHDRVGQPPSVEAKPLPPVFGPGIVQEDTHTAAARTVGVGVDATHALILPVAPTMDVSGPMGDTGEVLVTGNIPLPRHVSEQALTGTLEMEEDHSPYDQADGSSFTTPIRATDAVSSRTIQVDQPMIRRPRWGAASIVLGSSAAILGVTALGLLALALLTDIVESPF